MTPEERLRELGLTLPPPVQPIANFVGAVQSGRLLFLSGHVSDTTGKLGADVATEDGYGAAREAALKLLGTAAGTLGELTRVRRIVKLLGMVNTAPDFTDHPLVINGASDLLVAVFADAGRHARSAVGFASLPGNATVELEAVLEVD